MGLKRLDSICVSHSPGSGRNQGLYQGIHCSAQEKPEELLYLIVFKIGQKERLADYFYHLDSILLIFRLNYIVAGLFINGNIFFI